MIIALRIVALAVLLLVVPTIVGTLFFATESKTNSLIFAWVSGQMLLWAGFQVIAVPFILKEKTLSRIVMLYAVYQAILLLLAVAVGLYRMGKRSGLGKGWKSSWEKGWKNGGTLAGNQHQGLHAVPDQNGTKRVLRYGLWAVFALLLIFQLVQAVRLAYADGDDAYYVAVASIANASDTMYRKSVYSVGMMSVDARYGLAPFPIWIAFLARVTGLPTVSVAQVGLPLVLIPMTYGIYYLIGRRLFAKKGGLLPLFLIFGELLVLFSDYSFYTAENFMIARSRQGKAALGNIIIPMLLFLLYLWLEKMQEKRKVTWQDFLLLLSTATAACLCSTLAAFLTCMLIGITGICTAVYYKRFRFLIPMAACCIPCVMEALLYVLL